MIEKEIDLWEVEADLRCVTTNGSIYRFKDGSVSNPMGAGCASEAAERFPGVHISYGETIQRYGLHVCFLAPRVLAFPVKYRVEEKASENLIWHSLWELQTLIGNAEITIAIPRPGCGYGGLSWDDVRSIFEHLDDRFIVVDYPKSI